MSVPSDDEFVAHRILHLRQMMVDRTFRTYSVAAFAGHLDFDSGRRSAKSGGRSPVRVGPCEVARFPNALHTISGSLQRWPDFRGPDAAI